MAMLDEGMHPAAIEMAGVQAGMPVGPLALMDEVSLSLADHIRKQTLADLQKEGASEAAAEAALSSSNAAGVVEKMVR